MDNSIKLEKDMYDEYLKNKIETLETERKILEKMKIFNKLNIDNKKSSKTLKMEKNDLNDNLDLSYKIMKEKKFLNETLEKKNNFEKNYYFENIKELSDEKLKIEYELFNLKKDMEDLKKTKLSFENLIFEKKISKKDFEQKNKVLENENLVFEKEIQILDLNKIQKNLAIDKNKSDKNQIEKKIKSLELEIKNYEKILKEKKKILIFEKKNYEQNLNSEIELENEKIIIEKTIKGKKENLFKNQSEIQKIKNLINDTKEDLKNFKSKNYDIEKKIEYISEKEIRIQKLDEDLLNLKNNYLNKINFIDKENRKKKNLIDKVLVEKMKIEKLQKSTRLKLEQINSIFI